MRHNGSAYVSVGGLKKTANWIYAVLDEKYDMNLEANGFKVNIDL